MAPFMSIIQHLFENGTTRNVTYFYGAQTKNDLYYTGELRRLEEEYENFRFIIALSAPEKTDRWTGETGFIHQVVDKYMNSGEDMEAYLCGPTPMIDATIGVLVSKGATEESIFFDKI